ncbi:MAG: hypothetical protein COV44_00125 [Deltaproteobacteria bacterium CG11_big_fil_rev_8_21_14_0_20_45_16]|nr:MAG: hypothetical protein COV44_00125 [Deltaproteobacteria bacterium CG11_big_fil_rev_8_21_14_0_20_45_16]
MLQTEETLNQTPEFESNSNRYYRMSRLDDYKELSDALDRYSKLLEAVRPSEETFLHEVEAYFADISNSLVLENQEAQLIVEMNRLHTRAHGDIKEFEKWQKLLELSRALMISTQDLSDELYSDFPYRINVSALIRFATQDYFVETSNLLLHDPSVHFVRADQRGAKSLKEVLETTVGQHRPDKRFELLRFGVLFLKTLEQTEAVRKTLDAYASLESFLRDKLALSYLLPDQELPPGTDLVLNRLRENQKYQFDVRDLEFEPDFFISNYTPALKLSYVMNILNVNGEIHELDFELARDENRNEVLSTSVQTTNLYEIIELTKELYSLESFLRLKIIDQNTIQSPGFNLEFRFFRRSPHPQIGLNMTPWYFPLGGKQNVPAVSDLTNLGHQEETKIVKDVSMIWEDLRSHAVTWDQLVLIDHEKGTKISIPIEDKAGQVRHDRILYSLHPYDPNRAIENYKYQSDSDIPLKLRLRISLD